MGTFRITEFEKTAINDVPAPLQMVQYPAVAVQPALTPTGTTQQSAAFNANTTFACISTDIAVTFDVGTNPVATVGSELLSANESRYIGVRPGDKIAVRLA